MNIVLDRRKEGLGGRRLSFMLSLFWAGPEWAARRCRNIFRIHGQQLRNLSQARRSLAYATPREFQARESLAVGGGAYMQRVAAWGVSTLAIYHN